MSKELIIIPTMDLVILRDALIPLKVVHENYFDECSG